MKCFINNVIIMYNAHWQSSPLNRDEYVVDREHSLTGVQWSSLTLWWIQTRSGQTLWLLGPQWLLQCARGSVENQQQRLWSPTRVRSSLLKRLWKTVKTGMEYSFFINDLLSTELLQVWLARLESLVGRIRPPGLSLTIPDLDACA